jgi:protein-disulfide isomerase
MVSYVVNAGLLVLCVIVVWRTGVPPLELLTRDIRFLVSRPLLCAVLALAGLTGIVVLRAFVPSYWRTPGWTDLPKLTSGTDDHGHHWIGARAPALTIVEFSDYECPHCRAAHKAIRLFAAKHPARVRLVHRHLPLDMACHPRIRRPFHARACQFAEAAECAGLQGRFWEMNDALFSVQETTKTDDVDPIDLAVRLGLDRSEFERCIEQHTTAGRIADDVRAAMGLRLSGTPSFLINDRVFLGRMPESQLERLLPNAGE